MRYRAICIALVLAVAIAHAQDAGPLKFDVRLSPEAAFTPVSGRMLICMTNAKGDLATIETGFGGMFSGTTSYTAAQEVTNLKPGQVVTINPNVSAYPSAFSTAPRGTWQAMALLDTDHSYGRSERGPGDILSDVVKLPDLDPAHAGTVTLSLSRVIPPTKHKALTGIGEVVFVSPMLSRFWGRPISMRAAVGLPVDATVKRRYPTVYHVPGFGDGDEQAWWSGPRLQDRMKRGEIPTMAHVFLDPETPLGHTEYADSANNGPWGAALTREFIPYLERQYPLVATPGQRFLTGHSSGGWSTLWLQVSCPDFFNGTWSTGPDPVDFGSFCGVDLNSNPPGNMYRTPDQRLRNLVRFGGANTMSTADFCRYEQVAGDYGGQMASFEAVFSPKGPDGRPMRLFDRQTGEVDTAVARAWRKYDIRHVLEAGGKPLLAKLRGKVHIVVGDQDNFHLNEPVALLAAWLNSVKSDARVEIVKGRDHMNLYEGGLNDRMLKQMGERSKAAQATS
jgi:hypothetical protein